VEDLSSSQILTLLNRFSAKRGATLNKKSPEDIRAFCIDFTVIVLL
jgi:hypothetical protein